MIRKGCLRRGCHIHLCPLKQLGNAVATVFRRLTDRKEPPGKNSDPKALALPLGRCPAMGPNTYMSLISSQTPSRADFSELWDAGMICFAVFNKATPSMKYRQPWACVATGCPCPVTAKAAGTFCFSPVLSWPKATA